MEEEKTPAVCAEEGADGSVSAEENVSSGREDMLEAKLFCMENGVSAENCDVVIAACSAMDKQDAKEAIAEVLERYPFFKDGQHEKRGMTTGIHIENTIQTVLSGVEEAFFKANPDCC